MSRLSHKAVLGEVADRADRESIGWARIGPSSSRTSIHASFVDCLFEGLCGIALPNRSELVEWQRSAHHQYAGIDDLKQQLLAALHFLEQSGVGEIGRDAGIGKAPDIGNPIGGALVDRYLDAGLQVQADG